MNCQIQNHRYSARSIALFILLLGVYILSTPPDCVPGANGGELTAAGAVLGIAHPSGYPVWTVIAHGWSRSIPFGDIPFRINFLSAVCMAFAIVITHRNMLRIGAAPGTALVICFCLACHPVFFAEILGAEVYGFHLLLTLLVLDACLLARIRNDHRYSLLAVLFWSLSLGNHLLSVFTLPIFLTQVPVMSQRKRTHSMVIALTLLFLGLSVYLYLPVRLTENPGTVWRHPDHLSGFIRHVTGRDFHHAMGQAVRVTVSSNLSTLAMAVTPFPGCLLVALGIVAIPGCLRRAASLDRIAWLLFASGILLFPLMYAIHDIRSYFIVPIWLILGLASRHHYPIMKRRSIRIPAVILLGSTLLFTGIHSTTGEVNLHRWRGLRRYGHALLSAVPPGQHLVFQGDNAMNSIAWLLAIERYRDDILTIDANANLSVFPSIRRNRPGSDVPTSSFRLPRDYPLLKPHGMGYIDRNMPLCFPVTSLQATPDPPGSLQSVFDRSWYALPSLDAAGSRWNSSIGELAAQILINLAENEFEYGPWTAGIPSIREATQFAPTPEIVRFAASILAARGLLESAGILLEELTSRYPPDSMTLNNQAYYLFLQGTRIDDAVNLARTANQMEPTNPDITATFCRLLLASGRLGEMDALQHQPETPVLPELKTQLHLLRRFQTAHPVHPGVYSHPETIDTAIRDLPLPALNHHYRLFLSHKIRTMRHTASDLIGLADVCTKLKVPQAALAVLAESTHQTDPEMAPVMQALNDACFNTGI
ncbi:DUF2723 domain-containing protein [bacterium]|nr:DUF2723 domain-containing protein [candidate division CSSED10-310 bacterium]